jgi:thymidylate synthase
MNTLDKQYTDLLQDILDNGVTKEDRTGTGTISVFGRQIRHKMSAGFPLLTTKKMHFKSIATELVWFLRGRTDLRYLLENGCHIWTGDAYRVYDKDFDREHPAFSAPYPKRLTQKEFEEKIMTDDEFNKWYGDLGPIYGKQWRDLGGYLSRDIERLSSGQDRRVYKKGTDQIANLIHVLKTNPDSRRLMVNAWNVGELDSMVLPPCHYGFQVYTRELSPKERIELAGGKIQEKYPALIEQSLRVCDERSIPTRAISLMWNQRSVDTFLGLPFNIASYGLLLEIIAKAVNMVPDELIGNLGDTHLYSNHIEQATEQIGRELTYKERYDIWFANNYQTGIEYNLEVERDLDNQWGDNYEETPPYRTREPYPLPTLNINTEFWLYESGSCGEGPLDAVAIFNSFTDDNFCRCLLEEDIQLGNYQSHTAIKAPLSN